MLNGKISNVAVGFGKKKCKNSAYTINYPFSPQTKSRDFVSRNV